MQIYTHITCKLNSFIPPGLSW